ncbi:hypothetical protein B0H19DRAFT_577908 [Mycena capillaripes]|nr:hypothetical protein B0H19DRAFT_577908 [Mycena capillaripes]
MCAPRALLCSSLLSLCFFTWEPFVSALLLSLPPAPTWMCSSHRCYTFPLSGSITGGSPSSSHHFFSYFGTIRAAQCRSGRSYPGAPFDLKNPLCVQCVLVSLSRAKNMPRVLGIKLPTPKSEGDLFSLPLCLRISSSPRSTSLVPLFLPFLRLASGDHFLEFRASLEPGLPELCRFA